MTPHGKKSYKINDGDFPPMDGGEMQGAFIFILIIISIIIYIF